MISLSPARGDLTAQAPHLDPVATRFPLVPRPKPRGATLAERVARVHDLARRAAAASGGEALTTAAQAHNLSALILSDSGLPDQARTLCHQQHDLFQSGRPYDLATAKLALQPLINLARLHIRAGDSATAYTLLADLFEAVKTRTDTSIDGRTVRLADLVADRDAHRELVQWLWTVLLADGTRALTRAGHWAQALHHVEQHHGVGQRLLDGRQVAVLAHASRGDAPIALRLLAESATPSGWERAVAACLHVICSRAAAQPIGDGATTMLDRYLELPCGDDEAAFAIRLGLCVHALAAAGDAQSRIAATIERLALRSGDGYAAHEVLGDACAMSLTDAGRRHLTATVRACGLDQAAAAPRVRDDLYSAVATCENVMAAALTGRRP
ncbi:hypothetical protein AB0368_33415 [Actinoplanes sp. NPDC051475]|uniref:hypothetical protein n=1 Tax=Actinoplanes sp. NPDC051475 TaxID=3157225 RepID=UPI00344F1526